MINIEVEKGATENATGLIRRFTKKTRESGILSSVRGQRYRKRKLSKLVRKKEALVRLSKKQEYEKKLKLGKIIPKVGPYRFKKR